jgi:ActR/RegA family two-component response regulator
LITEGFPFAASLEETYSLRGISDSVNENVLLIGEDSRFMGTLTERICSKGVAVSFAQTASEALAILQRDDIDVVAINFNDLGADFASPESSR